MDGGRTGARGGSRGMGAERIRVLVLADIRLYREGLAAVLGRSQRLDVIDALGAPSEAVAVLRACPVDAVLIGMSAPSSLSAALAIGRTSSARMLALGVDDSDGSGFVALAEAGVVGYVAPEASLADLLDAIERAARGELVCSPSVAAGLVRRLAALAPNGGPEPAPARLTTREHEVLALLGEGLSNKEIAGRLCIEVPTVKHHVHNLLEKLQVRRRTEAVTMSRRGGWA